jgi:membrane protein required for colicin V production
MGLQGDVAPPADSLPIADEPGMPITLLDLILLVVMLVSALLAMIRGFIREVLSIAAWAVAAIVTVLFFNKLLPVAQSFFNNEIVAKAAVGAGLFLGTLLLASILTVRISDMILDSRVGALDRTLGFIFGLGRGLIIVVVAFLFFAWLVPDRSQPDWVRNAKSRVVLQSTGEWLMTMLPDDPESTILKRLKRPKPDEQDPPDAAPDRRTENGAPAKAAAASGANAMATAGHDDAKGYDRTDRSGMRQLIEGRPTAR